MSPDIVEIPLVEQVVVSEVEVEAGAMDGGGRPVDLPIRVTAGISVVAGRERARRDRQETGWVIGSCNQVAAIHHAGRNCELPITPVAVLFRANRLKDKYLPFVAGVIFPASSKLASYGFTATEERGRRLRDGATEDEWRVLLGEVNGALR